MENKLLLNPIEQSFLALDTSNSSQVISIICLVGQEIPEKAFREKFAKIAPQFKRLNYILKEPYWIFDPKFDPQLNLIFLKLPDTGRVVSVLENEFSKALDYSLPPWKIVITSGKENAIHFIFHHSLSDGMGIIDFIKALSDEELSKPKSEEIETKSKIFNKSLKLKAIKHVIKDCFKQKSNSPINGKNSSTRHINFTNLPIEEINKTRKHYQVSLHEYMLGLVTTSLEHYFKNNNYSLSKINVLTPVSHRHPRLSENLGNYITGMAVELDLKHQSIDARLEQIKNNFRTNINQDKDEIYIYLAHTVAKIPRILRRLLCNFAASRTHLICTSVPSSGIQEMHISNSKIIYKYGTAALMKGHGISIAFVRYLESMCVSIVSDPAIVKDPEIILDLINNSHQVFKANA